MTDRSVIIYVIANNMSSKTITLKEVDRKRLDCFINKLNPVQVAV